MEEKKICRYCGSVLTGQVDRCPECGATVSDAFSSPEKQENAGSVAVAVKTEQKQSAKSEKGKQAAKAVKAEQEQERIVPVETGQEQVITHPETIAELQQYCAQKGMPLIRMRFFIGENYKQPRAFGIYRDGDDFVVYKNKDNGNRAVRYKGPDEAFAVNEIFQKLLSECHLRGIYPDGEPDRSKETVSRGYKTKSQVSGVGLFFGMIALVAVIGIGSAIGNHVKHKKDGYYRVGETTYYRYGDDWSVYDPVSADWYWDDDVSFPYSNYEDYSVGDSYSADWADEWGISNIETSTVWDDWTSYDYDSSYDSSYDSWDSGTTDWSSDW